MATAHPASGGRTTSVSCTVSRPRPAWLTGARTVPTVHARRDAFRNQLDALHPRQAQQVVM